MTEPEAPGPDLRRLVGLDPNMTQGLPPVDHIKILRGDHPDQAAYDAVYDVIGRYPPLSTDETGKARENARLWRAVQAALDVANADRDLLAGLVERSSLGSADAVAARGQVHPETGRVLAVASVRLAEIAAERDRLAGLLDHATRFTFSDLPVGHPLRPAWAVDAVLCGSGTWEVRRGSWRLSRDGKWTTADGFSVEHQFDLDTALVVAKQAAHEMTIGTYTAAEVLAADEEGDCDD